MASKEGIGAGVPPDDFIMLSVLKSPVGKASRGAAAAAAVAAAAALPSAAASVRDLRRIYCADQQQQTIFVGVEDGEAGKEDDDEDDAGAEDGMLEEVVGGSDEDKLMRGVMVPTTVITAPQEPEDKFVFFGLRKLHQRLGHGGHHKRVPTPMKSRRSRLGSDDIDWDAASNTTNDECISRYQSRSPDDEEARVGFEDLPNDREEDSLRKGDEKAVTKWKEEEEGVKCKEDEEEVEDEEESGVLDDEDGTGESEDAEERDTSEGGESGGSVKKRKMRRRRRRRGGGGGGEREGEGGKDKGAAKKGGGPGVPDPYYPIYLPMDQAFKAKYVFHHKRAGRTRTMQERTYVFLEHPGGWLCFIYHFTV
ncbi:hypothetical protein J437_LFUL006731 [Ladona fulva]|uniref:Uncharacterized protein n=1 Tax=Ladona fulva TaxID=123851 RepID=A0A8K0NY75_LADFU|nr:hypothetical protein J437_LFUL006731 [Ladona fulva]